MKERRANVREETWPHHGGTAGKHRGNRVQWPPGTEGTRVYPEPRALKCKKGLPSWIRGKRFAAIWLENGRRNNQTDNLRPQGWPNTHGVQIYLPQMVQDWTQNCRHQISSRISGTHGCWEKGRFKSWIFSVSFSISDLPYVLPCAWEGWPGQPLGFPHPP